MSIIRHEIRQITDENRGQPIISQAVVHGNVAYFAGITPNPIVGDIKAQTAQVLRRIDELLKRAGTDKSQLLEHFPTMLNRHCERSEAIQGGLRKPLDCFVAPSGRLGRKWAASAVVTSSSADNFHPTGSASGRSATRNDAVDAFRPGNALSAQVWIADMGLFEDHNAVWNEWVDPANPPARACLTADFWRPGMLVEVMVVAAMP
jgi:enamine deaminase RidA (YjgF/YER057c/UK114 family)